MALTRENSPAFTTLVVGEGPGKTTDEKTNEQVREGDMKVVEWISDADTEGKTGSCGGLGGWFGVDGKNWEAPHRWADYLAATDPAEHPYVEAIKDDVLASDRFIDGNAHQNSDEGVPLFEDGTVGSFSFRAWGDLMAAIATEKDGKNHNYMEFYYS